MNSCQRCRVLSNPGVDLMLDWLSPMPPACANHCQPHSLPRLFQCAWRSKSKARLILLLKDWLDNLGKGREIYLLGQVKAPHCAFKFLTKFWITNPQESIYQSIYLPARTTSGNGDMTLKTNLITKSNIHSPFIDGVIIEFIIHTRPFLRVKGGTSNYTGMTSLK